MAVTTITVLLHLLFLLLLLITTTTSLSPRQNANTLPIHHAATTSSIHDLLSADNSRLVYLSSLAARRPSVPIAPGSKLLQSPTYIIRASLGTPPQSLLVAIDTSADAAWFPSSAFSPALSSSFRPLPCSSPLCSTATQLPNPSCLLSSNTCSFNFTYGASSASASLCQDSLSLIAPDSIANYTFGSLTQSSGTSLPPQGLLGLGRGPLSFLSQSKNLYSSTFSYCLPSFRSLNFSGTLRLGPAGQPARVRTTPLLSNPRRSSLYYVQLSAILVAKKPVPIPNDALAFDPATGAGTIIDSGTMFTRLVAPAYTAVRDEFRRRVGNRTVASLGGFDTCYNGPIAVPRITFVFGGGLSVTLPEENVMIHSSSGDLACLAMAAAPENVNSVVNVIASMQQQNHRVLFDGVNGRVGFAHEVCTKA